MTQRWRASPNFVMALSMDGRAYLAKDVEPYIQFWLSDRERMLFALFARRGGLDATSAADALLAATGAPDSAQARKRIAQTIAAMGKAGVLIGQGIDTSRYHARMAEDYVAHRPFPAGLARHIVERARIGATTDILDLAGGPGSLALELAKVSQHVAMMELSTGFIAAATKRAKADGLRLEAIHESCNRLVFHDRDYDVITISQALHWLDDVLVAKGVVRLLRDGGSFFVVHGELSLDDAHPLSYILGNRTPLGDKPAGSFAEHVEPLLKRLTLLFEALDLPGVERVDPTHRRSSEALRIVPVDASLFRQRRPIGEGFARAFLSPAHIERLSVAPEDFWSDLKARCALASAEQSIGTQEWAVLQFQRGGKRLGSTEFRRTVLTDIS